MKPPTDLRARVLAAAAREPAAPRPVVARRAALSLLAGYGVSLVLLLATGGMDATRRPLAFVLVSAGGWLAVAGSVAVAAYARGRSMLGRTTATLEALALGTAPLLLAWVAICTQGFGDLRSDPGNARAHAACFVFTLMYAAAPLVALLVTRRGSDPVHPRATGGALGAAAGAWGGVLIDLHCARTGMVHVALAHVLPSLVLALFGALVGGRLLAIRAEEAHSS